MAISILQLDEASLYASGLALLEQNLHTLDSQGKFDNEVRNSFSNVLDNPKRDKFSETVEIISDDFNYSHLDTEDWAEIQGGSVRSGSMLGADSLFFGAANETGQ